MGPDSAARRAGSAHSHPHSARAWSGPHPLLAAAGAGVLCGATLPAMRMALAEVAPIQLALLRYAIAAVCLLGALACARGLRTQRAAWLPAALLDMGQFGVLIALLAFGLRYTSATRAGLLYACFPVWVLLLAMPAWRERPDRRFVWGALLCLAGVSLALADGSYVRPARYAWIGETAVCVSVVIGAICSLLLRAWLARLPILKVGACAMGASVLLLILLAGSGWSAGLHLSARGWVMVLYLGISCAGAYALWLYALAHAPAARVLPYLACAPLASSLLGACSLHERQSGWLLAALACVIAGLVLALRHAPPAIEAAPDGPP